MASGEIVGPDCKGGSIASEHDQRFFAPPGVTRHDLVEDVRVDLNLGGLEELWQVLPARVRTVEGPKLWGVHQVDEHLLIDIVRHATTVEVGDFEEVVVPSDAFAGVAVEPGVDDDTIVEADLTVRLKLAHLGASAAVEFVHPLIEAALDLREEGGIKRGSGREYGLEEPDEPLAAWAGAEQNVEVVDRFCFDLDTLGRVAELPPLDASEVRWASPDEDAVRVALPWDPCDPLGFHGGLAHHAGLLRREDIPSFGAGETGARKSRSIQATRCSQLDAGSSWGRKMVELEAHASAGHRAFGYQVEQGDDPFIPAGILSHLVDAEEERAYLGDEGGVREEAICADGGLAEAVPDEVAHLLIGSFLVCAFSIERVRPCDVPEEFRRQLEVVEIAASDGQARVWGPLVVVDRVSRGHHELESLLRLCLECVERFFELCLLVAVGVLGQFVAGSNDVDQGGAEYSVRLRDVEGGLGQAHGERGVVQDDTALCHVAVRMFELDRERVAVLELDLSAIEVAGGPAEPGNGDGTGALTTLGDCEWR